MKRFLFCALAAVLLGAVAGAMSSCKGCKGEAVPSGDGHEAYHDYDGVVEDFTAGVAHVQALHRQLMHALAAGQEYQWRNSKVVLNDAITTENIDDLHVTDVNDVFCYWNDKGPWVQYVNSSVTGGLQVPWPINDVWIEDSDLSGLQIKLTAEDALQRLKEWNGVIPEASSLSLRCPVGPKACNAQWVIGGVYDVLFIDAVTGAVSDKCPAF